MEKRKICEKEMKTNDPIYVTRPFIPPLAEYHALLETVWDSQQLANNGPMVTRLERSLASELGSSDFVCVNNGTTAIQLGIKALKLKGEIITTPFTWIATVGAIKAEGCIPRFCDIDPQTLNIDVDKIEALISPSTVAIMPVHVFGNPCDVYRIEEIARRHNLKVIYDAAHALGTTVNGRTVLEYGDVSAVSLHATKLLNTGEGGGCISPSEDVLSEIRRSRNFGLDEQAEVIGDGVNGKLSEVNAALGVAGLPYLSEIIADRREKYALYVSLLSGCQELSLQVVNGDGCNCMYFPLVFESEALLLQVQAALNQEGIFPRRYFYPSLTQYASSMTGDPAPIADDIATRILCLPLYYSLAEDVIERISQLILQELSGVS